jgi:catechol 2,3-dioxygenase-like lactoylglutathione lyase family enzyme
MSHVRRFDHVGITVADLDTVTAFFVGLGFEVEGRTFVEGEFLDTVIGIPDSRTEIVMLRPPDGGFLAALRDLRRTMQAQTWSLKRLLSSGPGIPSA